MNHMKRFFLILLTLCLLLPLVACGGENKEINKTFEQKGNSSADPAGSVNGFLFKTGETTVAVDEVMSTVLAALGDKYQYNESASCAFNGLDKMYSYDHFEIDSYPVSDTEDRVQAICLMDDLVSTMEGLRIGDSRARVEELYGTDCEVLGTECIYSKGGMKLKIMIENDVVTFITYLSCAADFN